MRVLMQELEEPIRKTLEALKAIHKHYLVLKKRPDGYYVIEAMPKWDEKLQRYTLMSLYIGKIEKDGKFIEPIRKRSSTKDARNLDEYIEQRERSETREEKEAFGSEYEPLILKELSTNPRDGVAAISKRIGLPYSTTLYWIKKLEKKYNIRYTIEYWFIRQFDLNRYIAIVKFKDKRPKREELKALLEKNPYVQLAVSTRGAYDLFLFIIANKPGDAENVIYNLRSSPVLSHCPADWQVSYYAAGMGLIPLRDKFFDIIKDRVWRRSKETPRKQKDQIFMREYATLRELNSNGLIDFSEIDKKYGLKQGSAQYTYHKLVNDRMLERVTGIMETMPKVGAAIFIAKQRNVGLFNEHRKEYLSELISDSDEVMNRYVFVGDIGSPYGIILISPLFNQGDLENVEESVKKVAKGSIIRTSVITDVLIGSLGFRRLDLTKTWAYETLVKEYNYKVENNLENE